MIKTIQKNINKILGTKITDQQTRTILAVISAIGYRKKSKIPDYGLIANEMTPGGQSYDIARDIHGVIDSIDVSTNQSPGLSVKQTITIRLFNDDY